MKISSASPPFKIFQAALALFVMLHPLPPVLCTLGVLAHCWDTSQCISELCLLIVLACVYSSLQNA